jgi:hypothetical protein
MYRELADEIIEVPRCGCPYTNHERMPLPHNGYCPSHQHLVATEDSEALVAA